LPGFDEQADARAGAGGRARRRRPGQDVDDVTRRRARRAVVRKIQVVSVVVAILA